MWCDTDDRQDVPVIFHFVYFYGNFTFMFVYIRVLTLLYYIAPAAGFYVGAFFSLFLRHIVSRVILRFSISL